MDIARPSNAKKKRIRNAIYAVVGLLAVVLVSVGLSRLKPAAPTVERAVVWPDTVEARSDGAAGPRPRHADAGRHPVDSGDDAGTRGKDHLAAGHSVNANDVILELTNPQLEQQLQDARAQIAGGRSGPREHQGAAAATTCSQQRAAAAQVEADYNKAKMQAEMNEALAKDQLVSELVLKQSQVDAEQLGVAQPDREGSAGEQDRIDARADRRAQSHGRSGARRPAAHAATARRAEGARRPRRHAAAGAGRSRSAGCAGHQPRARREPEPAESRNQDRGNPGQRHPDRTEGRSRHAQRRRRRPRRAHRSVGAERHAHRGRHARPATCRRARCPI